jgi:hypothetical protein
MPSYNPSLPYRTVTDKDGNIFIFQNDLYYDKNGNTSSTPPFSQSGPGPVSDPVAGTRLIGVLRGANMNVTTDQAIQMFCSKYRIKEIIVANPSVSLTTAVGGFYDALAKGGNILVPNTQAYAKLTGASLMMSADLTSYTGQVATAQNIYFSLTTGQGAAATADILVYGVEL